MSDAALGERVDELNRALRLILPEGQHRLLFERDDAQEHLQWREQQRAGDRLVDALAKHFPGTAPAIRAIAFHVDQALEHDDTPRCGLEDGPILSFREHDCLGRTPTFEDDAADAD